MSNLISKILIILCIFSVKRTRILFVTSLKDGKNTSIHDKFAFGILTLHPGRTDKVILKGKRKMMSNAVVFTDLRVSSKSVKSNFATTIKINEEDESISFSVIQFCHIESGSVTLRWILLPEMTLTSSKNEVLAVIHSEHLHINSTVVSRHIRFSKRLKEGVPPRPNVVAQVQSEDPIPHELRINKIRRGGFHYDVRILHSNHKSANGTTGKIKLVYFAVNESSLYKLFPDLSLFAEVFTITLGRLENLIVFTKTHELKSAYNTSDIVLHSLRHNRSLIDPSYVLSQIVNQNFSPTFQIKSSPCRLKPVMPVSGDMNNGILEHYNGRFPSNYHIMTIRLKIENPPNVHLVPSRLTRTEDSDAYILFGIYGGAIAFFVTVALILYFVYRPTSCCSPNSDLGSGMQLIRPQCKKSYN